MRGGPVVMLNLLKFHERAQYRDGRADQVSGREAYMRYADEMQPIVEGAGGRFLFSGDVQGLVIGAVEELWDLVGIVEYPSRAEFFRIATSPEVHDDRCPPRGGTGGAVVDSGHGPALIRS